MIQKDAMPRTSINEDGPNPIDTHVGNRVRSRRLMIGLSQEALAKSIGLTFQQVQKYEKGMNRISVSRLVDICKVLKVSIDYFLEGLSPADARKLNLRGVSDNKQETLEPDMPMIKKDTLELIRAYQKIKTPALKKQLLEMAKAMASANNDA